MAGIVDSFWISLGFRTDTSGLETMDAKAKQAKSSMVSIGDAIAGVAAAWGVHRLAAGVAELGSQFESNASAVGLFLSQFGMASDFNDGLKKADGVLQSITTAAAKLPGEAEEYIEVYRAGLPAIADAFKGQTPEAVADFTNMFTALGKTLQVDAPQIGRDLSLMLGPMGRAGSHVLTFARMLGALRRLPGMEALDAQKFNAMSQAQRIALIRQVTESKNVKDAMDHVSKSYDAMRGAAIAGAKQIARVGTAGIFDQMKRSLEKLTATFITADGKFTPAGKRLVETISNIGSVIGRVLEVGTELVVFFGESEGAARGLKVAIGLVGLVLASLAASKALAMVTKLATGFRLAAVASVLLGAAIFLIAEDLWGFYNGAESVTGELVDKWAPALYAIIVLLGALTFLFSPLLLAIGLVTAAVVLLYTHWQSVLDLVQAGLNGWIADANRLVDLLNTILGLFGDARVGKFGEFTFADEHRNKEHGFRNMLAPGEGVLPMMGPQNPVQSFTGGLTGADFWQRDQAARGGAGSSTHSETHVGTVNITGNDNPQKVGRDWDRHVRDEPSKVRQ